MAEPLNPLSTPTFGRENWILATVASLASPLTSEATANSALDITLIGFADQVDRPTQSTNVVSAIRRFGATRVPQRLGVTSYAGGNMTYLFNTQQAPATGGATPPDGRRLYDFIPEGTTKTLLQRIGVTRATAPTAGQRVNAYLVQFGPSLPTVVGNAEEGESAAQCTYVILDQQLDVALG